MANSESIDTKGKTATSAIPRRDFLQMIGGAGALAATEGAVLFWPNQAQADAIEQRRSVRIAADGGAQHPQTRLSTTCGNTD